MLDHIKIQIPFGESYEEIVLTSQDLYDLEYILAGATDYFHGCKFRVDEKGIKICKKTREQLSSILSNFDGV